MMVKLEQKFGYAKCWWLQRQAHFLPNPLLYAAFRLVSKLFCQIIKLYKKWKYNTEYLQQLQEQKKKTIVKQLRTCLIFFCYGEKQKKKRHLNLSFSLKIRKFPQVAYNVRVFMQYGYSLLVCPMPEPKMIDKKLIN